MEQIIDSFDKEIEVLENHMFFNQELKKMRTLDDSMLSHLRSYKKKELDYKLVVISLYGIIESHIDKMILRFLEHLEIKIEYYNFIADKIKTSHFSNSINLASILDSKNYAKFEHLNKHQIIRNLQQCISNEIPYTINKDAFLINTGNLKHSKIAQAFSQVGLNLTEELKTFEYFDFASENTFNKIDTVVDLRNEIAHGNITTILDSSELIPLIDFSKNYFHSICELTSKYLHELILEYNYGYKSYSLGKTTLFGTKIIGFNYKEKFQIEVGDKIIIRNKQGVIKEAEVIDKKTSGKSCTIKLDRNLKEGFLYFVIKASS